MIAIQEYQNLDEQVEIRLDFNGRLSGGESPVAVTANAINELDGTDSSAIILLSPATIGGSAPPTVVSQWVKGAGPTYEQHLIFLVVTGDAGGRYRETVRLIRNLANRYL